MKIEMEDGLIDKKTIEIVYMSYLGPKIDHNKVLIDSNKAIELNIDSQ